MNTSRVKDLRLRLARRKAELATSALLLLMTLNLLSVVAKKSITIDEASAIPAGYYHLTRGAFHVNSEHPPLPKMFAALPLLFTGTQAPPLESRPGEIYSQRTVALAPRFWQANRERFRTIFFWARVPMILTTAATGLLVFAFARRLFGDRAAVLAVALFSLEPNILAHGRIVKDIHVAFAYLLFFFALYLYWTKANVRRALLLGLATGLAPAVKFSMGVVAPVAAVAACALVLQAPARGMRRSRVLLQLGLAAALALVVINAAYLFQHQPLTAADVQWVRETSPARGGMFLSAVGVLGNVVPPYFLFGIYAVLAHDAGDHHVFLLGRYSTTGWWYYFPTAFALKTTLTFLAVTVAAIAWSLLRVIRGRDAKFLFLLVPVAVYALLAATTSINIGIRHLLPAFPFLFIMGGALLDRALRSTSARRAAQVCVVVALCWMAVEVVRAYPHYVPYMNQLAARGEPWQYLSDSNVEWGDDVGELAEYLKARGETRVRAALLGGPVILPLYGVEYVDMLSPPEVRLPETRYVAIGASFLNGSTVPGWGAGSGRETKEQQRNFFDAYRRRTPEAVFGHSIYLYRVE